MLVVRGRSSIRDVVFFRVGSGLNALAVRAGGQEITAEVEVGVAGFFLLFRLRLRCRGRGRRCLFDKQFGGGGDIIDIVLGDPAYTDIQFLGHRDILLEQQ